MQPRNSQPISGSSGYDAAPFDGADSSSGAERGYEVPEWNPTLEIRLGGTRRNDAKVSSSTLDNADSSRPHVPQEQTTESLTLADRGETKSSSRGNRVDAINVLLAIILVLALVLRVVGTDWDQGGLYHPDERDFLGRAERLDFGQLTEPAGLLSVESRLNPQWFNYGSLPLYVLSGWRSIAANFGDRSWNIFDLRFPGRNLAAIADTLTVFFVFLLTARLVGDRRAGLIAALLTALAVIHIQNAHYTAVDAPMTMFIVATVYFSVRLVQERRQTDALLAGVMLGLALATKFSAAPVALAVGAAHLLLLARPGMLSGGVSSVRPADVVLMLRYGILSASAALIALLVTQPYMIIDWDTYFGNVYQQSEMVRRVVDLPFTRQYIDTPAFLYQIRQLSTWGLGISLGIAVWLGLIWALGRTIVKRDLAFVVVLSFLLPYLLVNGQFEVKFLRYMLPATPFLITFTGGAIWWLHSWVLPKVHSVVRYGAYALGLVALLFLAHYTIAYLNVFTGPHPAQEVSRWLRENETAGAMVIQEHWEEGIPNIPGFDMHQKLPMYENDNSSKFSSVARLMSDADYFVLYSNRLAATIPRLPDRYPISSRFYEMLFNGELGYEVVYSSVRVPSFLGVVYWDDPYARVPFDVPAGYNQPRGDVYNWDWFGWADESFTVYEHPHAIIFKNVDKLSQIRLLGTLYRDGHPDDFNPVLTDGVGLMYDEEQAATQRSGDSWNTIYFLRDLPNEWAWLVWLIAVQLISACAVPLTYLVFRPLTDRGYLFSKPLGLLIVATIAWLFASLGVMGFSVLSVAVSFSLLALVSLTIMWRIGDEIIIWFKANLKTIAIAELVFFAAFLLLLGIRLANPDLWHAWRGGEKPMDFAYLNAITRSTIMPPYDPWFAGGYLNYYYFGQFIIATLIRMTGIVPSVAYNLAVPLVFALTATSVYTVGYNLVAMAMRARGKIRLGKVPIAFGLVAAALAVVAGNIDGLAQVASGLYESVVRGGDFPNFDYWRSTRVFEHGTGGNEITEFPFFTFLYADLHAHMIALPFAALALGLSIVAFMRAGMVKLSNAETIIALVLLGITVGSLRLINSWDYPTQLILAGGFILAGEYFFGQRGKLLGLVYAGVKFAFVAIVGYVVYLPFHANFELFNNGIELSQFQTSLWRYLLIHALFVFAIGSWLAMEWRRGTFRFGSIMQILREEFGYSKWTPTVLIGVFVLVCMAIGFAYPQYLAVVLLLAATSIVGFTALVVYLRRHPGQRYIVVTIALIAMSLLLAAGVDVVTVKNDIGRQNTIFKFYIQAWWLLAIAASFAFWRLWDVGAFVTEKLSGLRTVWFSVCGVLVVGVFIFPVMATDARLDERFAAIGPGVDGEAYMDEGAYNTRGITIEFSTDRAGIEWLRENVNGSPVVVEAQWDLYTWANRVSIYTGLPTILGWDWHQTQQRHDYRWEIQRRRAAINDFYTTRDAVSARRFLDEFNVRYVYVGELERGAYPSGGIAKFDEMPDLRLVFDQGPVRIYEYRG